MTFLVVVFDRDAGWIVEEHGPYTTLAEADSVRRRLRKQFTDLRALPSIVPVRNANDSYEIRIVEHGDSSPSGSAA